MFAFAMKNIRAALAALLIWQISDPAGAQQVDAERWRSAMGSARWTGPLLASTAETLPQGHFYTEPYFFDVISSGRNYPGSSGFYQYGLFNNYTVGVQPSVALGTRKFDRNLAIGDFKLLSQLRLSHFTAEHRVPSIALVMNLSVPTGRYDELRLFEGGHGTGSYAPELGLNIQQYFLLRNGRLLRTRLNFMRNFPLRTDVSGRSVYGTSSQFEGRAKPGSKTTIVAALEYSVSREWVLAFDVERDAWGKTRVKGRNLGGPVVDQASARSWDVGIAPAIEYNWSDRAGAIFGLWIVPRGHNTSGSVTPAIAIQRFW